MADASMFYLVPEEKMDLILEKLERIEAQTRQRAEPVEQIGKVYTAQALADRLGVKVNTIYVWARQGRLRCVHAGRRVLFPDVAVEAFMEESHG